MFDRLTLRSKMFAISLIAAATLLNVPSNAMPANAVFNPELRVAFLEYQIEKKRLERACVKTNYLEKTKERCFDLVPEGPLRSNYSSKLENAFKNLPEMTQRLLKALPENRRGRIVDKSWLTPALVSDVCSMDVLDQYILTTKLHQLGKDSTCDKDYVLLWLISWVDKFQSGVNYDYLVQKDNNVSQINYGRPLNDIEQNRYEISAGPYIKTLEERLSDRSDFQIHEGEWECKVTDFRNTCSGDWTFEAPKGFQICDRKGVRRSDRGDTEWSLEPYTPFSQDKDKPRNSQRVKEYRLKIEARGDKNWTTAETARITITSFMLTFLPEDAPNEVRVKECRTFKAARTIDTRVRHPVSPPPENAVCGLLVKSHRVNNQDVYKGVATGSIKVVTSAQGKVSSISSINVSPDRQIAISDSQGFNCD